MKLKPHRQTEICRLCACKGPHVKPQKQPAQAMAFIRSVRRKSVKNPEVYK